MRGFLAAAIAAFFLLPGSPAHAQTGAARLTVRVLHESAPLPGAIVRAGDASAVTGARGTAVLALAPGAHRVVVARAGFAADSVGVTLAAGVDTTITVSLAEAVAEVEAVVATATRSGTILQDQPIRVEAVPQEEIEENQTVAPGGLTTLLEELPGVQIQASAPGLGGAGLRLRGLPARHSQVLMDGLPLLGAESDAFGLLQVPPLDLSRVEVIKGVASALYGGSALGGVLNLVSKGPTGDPTALVNRTSRGGTDAVAFIPLPLARRLGATVTGGAHAQAATDVDGDAWADLPSVRRAEVRPRLFWTGASGSSFFATVGATAEDRTGGALFGRPLPDGSTYRESLRTRRLDGGFVGHAVARGGTVLGTRGSLTWQHHGRDFGGAAESDAEVTGYGEATAAGMFGPHTWVVGTALTYDALRSAAAPGAEYTYTTPAIFAQDELAPADWLRVAASARADFQDRYGTFVSPRLSALVRPAASWNVRLSAGTGFALPHPLVDEVETVGLRHLAPMTDLRPERAASASLDAGWSGGGWELNASLFAADVRHPLEVRGDPSDPSRLRLVNLASPLRTRGVEALARRVIGPLQAIASYTHLDATEPGDRGVRVAAERVPRDGGELALLLEKEAVGRVGFELGYTGRQRVEDDPYRAFGRPYVELNFLAAKSFGESAIFINAIDLTDVRQTRFDPLLLPSPSPTGRRTTDVWAPLEGRVINLGARIEF
jgi:iron complex outermembrane receptor protein